MSGPSCSDICEAVDFELGRLGLGTSGETPEAGHQAMLDALGAVAFVRTDGGILGTAVSIEPAHPGSAWYRGRNGEAKPPKVYVLPRFDTVTIGAGTPRAKGLGPCFITLAVGDAVKVARAILQAVAAAREAD